MTISDGICPCCTSFEEFSLTEKQPRQTRNTVAGLLGNVF